MKLIHQLSILFLLLTLTSCAQEATFSEDVLTYVKNNGTAKQYEYAYDQLITMLSSQFPKTESNVEGWEFMNTNKEKYVSEILVLLAPVYEKNFSHEEIKKMNEFYQSEAGKQLVVDRSKMSEEQKVSLNDFYSSEVGKKIIEKQPILTKEIGVVSENWSRDLYETALSLLK